MFNVDWPSGRVFVPKGRTFESLMVTSPSSSKAKGNTLFDRLASLPCLFCEEGTTTETAYVGQINRLGSLAGMCL